MSDPLNELRNGGSQLRESAECVGELVLVVVLTCEKSAEDSAIGRWGRDWGIEVEGEGRVGSILNGLRRRSRCGA